MKKVALATGVLVLTLAAYIAYQRRPVHAPKAYTLYLEERNGERLIREIRIALRSEGTRVQADRLPNWTYGISVPRRAIQFPNNHRVVTWEGAKLKTTVTRWTAAPYLARDEFSGGSLADCSTPQYRVVGRKIVDRLTIYQTRRHDGHEIQRAAELGCEVVGTNDGTALHMIRWEAGEPESRLFALDGFEEAPYRAAYFADLKALGFPEAAIRSEEARMSGTRGGSGRQP